MVREPWEFWEVTVPFLKGRRKDVLHWWTVGILEHSFDWIGGVWGVVGKPDGVGQGPECHARKPGMIEAAVEENECGSTAEVAGRGSM